MNNNEIFHVPCNAKVFCLNGDWQFQGVDPQAPSPNEKIVPSFESSYWKHISVPGDVNAALLKEGLIPNPHFDTQARECYWVTSKEWWYKKDFDVPILDRGADLCLTGIEGIADIWLNGKYLGCMQNAFRLYRLNVTGVLQKQGNSLLLRFRSLDQFFEGPRHDELRGWFGRRTFIRKEQYTFGWDWALPLPSIGLSQNVWLEIDNDFRFCDFSIRSFVSGRVDFSFEVSRKAKEYGYCVNIEIRGHGNILHETIAEQCYHSYVSLEIENPQLWWPNGYGPQPLYDYKIELIVEGVVCDCKEGRFGLRESRIVEQPFSPEAGRGFSFGLEINGEAIFCQGANWIPLDFWPGVIKSQQYEFYLRKAKAANFNMIRVWGGGFYEADLFYELCDEFGLMVWQDFMYGGSYSVPVDLLREEIKAESEYQIKRLRNHPCLVLWCGGNEDIASFALPEDYAEELASINQDDTMALRHDTGKWNVDRLSSDKEIFTMILRGLADKYGLGVPYINSSPESRDDIGNSHNSGNSHLSCWKYALFETNGQYDRFREFFDSVSSFNSEFCIQGPCSQKAIKTFMAPQNHWPPNEAWTYHIQRGHRDIPHHEQTLMVAGGIFGPITSLSEYVKYGQAAHAEMMRAEFESARRDRPNNGGTMVWAFNDCWPTSNWATIDYYRTPKPAYYAAQRACAPLLPIIFERSGNIEFFLSSEIPQDVQVDIVYGQETLSGQCVWSDNTKLLVNANTTLKFDKRSKSDLAFSRGDYLYIETFANGIPFEKVIYFPEGWKNIPWPEPGISIECIEQVRQKDQWYTRLRVVAEQFGRMVHLCYPDEEATMWFGDNYFDLSAGSDRETVIESLNKIDPTKIGIGHWLTEWQ